MFGQGCAEALLRLYRRRATVNELETYICAMANTSGGIIASGIKEPPTPGRAFTKSGFDPTRKNSLNDIRNQPFVTGDREKVLVSRK